MTKKTIITKQNQTETQDEFRNNTNFPDSIMGPMTMKGLLGKWTAYIVDKIRYCLSKYYFSANRNIDAGHKGLVTILFKETNDCIKYATPILEDLVSEDICGTENILISVYGIDSDEVYAYKRFAELTSKNTDPGWDESNMWNDCGTDSRLKSYLF